MADLKKENNAKKEVANKALEKKEAKEVKSVKYLVKSSKELGFEKRNYFIPGVNEKVLIIADDEVDEKTYNLFTSYCKQVFFRGKK